ncbi:alpha/beta hydrolase [Rhodococcus sp. BP-252]|uniref:alpha/beta hydrolase n=1 Tax=unclassified Rhodococcus (in: high G+C Gram-positive bacteria) TaxID=192944 RepID=UPI001431F59F|nr:MULTISPECIES: alpha/beta hydrolase [unclassified Rhodococcus (in: high G+C Gram-positive bacteria)]MBY6411025.1 alpha/beta hydrolase [Rhodococcus sp. BP-320]MBY6415684.1 alpha/beta hydrolase [Rhodococcus sp. BP-321]MBY6420934.1 alpha/beta hydrolase [Rhodococcus sp. BP-324]MBY6425989.1 alpha/beta hydrolase [Rhodococcus sp. BP-323]MBY6430890.1 alpha/beta hydrolase [Rhodococcus sp. BP-322]
MTADRYARFLPSEFRVDHAPTSTMWPWRGESIHVARARNDDAPFRVLAIHGAGGHSGALWPYAALAASRGADVLFPDMPLYGKTVVSTPGEVRYQHWVDMLCDLVVAERQRDSRPIVMFGASMGGMLAYEVASRTGEVADVLATCLLDPSDPDARSAAARFGVLGRPAPMLLEACASVFGRVRVPVRWLMDVGNMSGNSELSRQCATDPLGGGVSVPIGFLSSFMSYEHVRPEAYDGPAVTLVHPAEDRWTPPEVSIRFLERVAGPTSLVMLEGCGHFPIEQPGLSQLVDVVESMARKYGWAP